MAVSEVTSTYVQRPTTPVLHQGHAGVYDSSLLLKADGAVTADGQTTAITVEGGSWADWYVDMGAVSGTTPTLTLYLEASLDGGSSYAKIATLNALDADDASTLFVRRVWIPAPTTTTSSNVRPSVRLNSVVGGTTPSFTFESFLTAPSKGQVKGMPNYEG